MLTFSLFWGEVACPGSAPASPQRDALWQGCYSGSISLHPPRVPKKRAGLREVRWDRVAAPNSWQSAVHTRLISPGRVCAAGASRPGRGGHPAPAGAPSSVPTCQGVSQLFGVLLRLLNKSFVCWCCAALGRPALRDVPRCRCHRRSLLPLVPAVSRGTEIRPSALVFQNQCLTGLFALPSSHGRGTAGHQHPLEMSQHPHTSSVPS